jgi:phosphotransferase system HPr (HPr) family protein
LPVFVRVHQILILKFYIEDSLSMVIKKVKVKNEEGLHARPSSVLVKTASRFKSDFYIRMYGYKVNGKSILGVMTLAAECGSEMELLLEGPDEKEAADVIEKLFDNQFEMESS